MYLEYKGIFSTTTLYEEGRCETGYSCGCVEVHTWDSMKQSDRGHTWFRQCGKHRFVARLDDQKIRCLKSAMHGAGLDPEGLHEWDLFIKVLETSEFKNLVHESGADLRASRLAHQIAYNAKIHEKERLEYEKFKKDCEEFRQRYKKQCEEKRLQTSNQ